MYISQSDVAQLSDVDLKRLVIAARTDTDDRLEPLWHAFSDALIRVIQERRLSVAVFEQELLNGDDPGELVGPDDDPVADALRELRGEAP